MMFQKKNKLKIKIEGMHCEHCAKKVEKSLKEIDGISKVKINLLEKVAIVTLKGQILDDEVKEKIEELGYEFLGIDKTI